MITDVINVVLALPSQHVIFGIISTDFVLLQHGFTAMVQIN
jgi:hypothetical protein